MNHEWEKKPGLWSCRDFRLCPKSNERYWKISVLFVVVYILVGFLLLLFLLVCFLWPWVQKMDIPTTGIESEPQLGQYQILYPTALGWGSNLCLSGDPSCWRGNARSLTGCTIAGTLPSPFTLKSLMKCWCWKGYIVEPWTAKELRYPPSAQLKIHL